jgi:hypothetical protein
MHHVKFGPLLQALLVVLLAVPALQIVRITGWRGRLALLAFAIVCAVANPGRARHVRALQRAVPGADVRLLDEVVEFHNLVVVSAASIRGRLVSLGGFDRLLVGSISCATLSTISNKSSANASKDMCTP